jgi:radical SAM superfamily enzyme YgiQ (UPF0313 family)
MKILFIYVSDLYEKPFSYFDYQMTPGDIYVPKIGILSLIASLRNEFPDSCYKAIDILNPSNRSMPEEQLEKGILNTLHEDEFRNEISVFNPDIVGLSSLSSNARYLPKLTKIIKEIKKDTLCILGGPFATSSSKTALLVKGIDFVFYGEGEVSICNFVRALVNGGDFNEIRGIGFLKNGNAVFTQPQPYVDDLNALPFPAWDLCNLENYSKVHRYLGSGVQHSDKTNYASIVSSRGCPYKCIYCHKILGSKFRFRTAQNVVDEMVYLHDEFNVEEFTFSDDMFNLSQKRVVEFCRLLNKSRRNIKFGFFTNGLRGDILTEELIDILYEAGMRTASVAIESASPRIQKKIRKNLDLDKTRKNIEYMCGKGVYLSTYNMIGFPTETADEIKRTLEFNLHLPHHAQFAFAVTPHEGTELYDMLIKEGYDLMSDAVGNLWQPQKVEDSFRAVSSPFVQLMLIKFFTEFYFTRKRLEINLKIMEQNRRNPFFVASLKRLYRNHWEIFARAVPRTRRQEVQDLLDKFLVFKA